MVNCNLDDLGLLANNFKCFGMVPQGFVEFRPFNIIIGKNNTGKSALIEIVESVTPNSNRDKLNTQRQGAEDTQNIFIRTKLGRPEIKDQALGLKNNGNNNFGPQSVMINNRPSPNPIYEKMLEYWVVGRSRGDANHTNFEAVSNANDLGHQEILFTPEITTFTRAHTVLFSNYRSPFSRLYLYRVLAERDITTTGNVGDVDLMPSGDGATSMIWAFTNQSKWNDGLVHHELLNALNEIYKGDNFFSRIRVAQHADAAYEIQLEEKNKGLINLSASGSSLKTVILVLLNLILIPSAKNVGKEQLVFAFEELENNLHPALLRRLFLYLEKYQVKNKCTFILSTHSNVAIDWFAKKDYAQILHVTHDGSEAQVSPAISHKDTSKILDDLEIKASDLLQANCVIWVEGPSDRIYLNRWIKIWSKGILVEGAHYQIALYGGALIKHITANPNYSTPERVSLLRINRNSAIIIDSDRRSASGALKKEVSRIKKEAEEAEVSMIWISKGKEVENYIPASIWKSYCYPKTWKGVGPFENVFEHPGIKQFKDRKVDLANKLKPLMKAKEEFSKHLDLDKKMTELCNNIKKWNYMN